MHKALSRVMAAASQEEDAGDGERGKGKRMGEGSAEDMEEDGLDGLGFRVTFVSRARPSVPNGDGFGGCAEGGPRETRGPRSPSPALRWALGIWRSGACGVRSDSRCWYHFSPVVDA